jgi:hypothetical protein
VDFSNFQSQNAIIDLPYVSSPTRRVLGSLPTSPVTPNLNVAYADDDFEMGNVAHDAESDVFHSDLRSSPSHNSEVDDNKEYHPIINGMFLFNFDHIPI